MSRERRLDPSRIPPQSVGRLSLYRRMLYRIRRDGRTHIYSHEIARACACTSAQVRRDLMAIESVGHPKRGYTIDDLLRDIGHVLDVPGGQRVVLVGIGNLGRALLAYFPAQQSQFAIVAAFDRDPEKVDRVYSGCPCYPMQQLDEVIRREGATLGIIAVNAKSAQVIGERLVAAGVEGILNFAPTGLHLSGEVVVENLDVTMALEKTAYFARWAPERHARKPRQP